MNKIFPQFLIFLAGSLVCLYLAFSPAVHIPYANHDSIRFFHKFYNNETGSSTYPQYRYEYNLGRPVTAELEGFLYRKVDHLSDLSHLRSMTIVIFALSASILAMTALSAGLGSIQAFCLCTAIFTLPGIQEFIFVPYLTNALAVLLSLLAYSLSINKLKYGIHHVFAFVLLETSFFLYPPSTFFFLIPASLMVLFQNNWPISKKRLMKDVGLWILAAVINYLILRVFFYAQMKASSHEIAFSLKQTLSFMMTFLPNGMPQIFNLWDVYYSKALGFSLMLFVGACILADFFVARMIGLKRLCAFLVLFLISNAVWFLFGGYQPREYIVAQALALILIYWSVEWVLNMLKIKNESLKQIWPIAFICTGLIIANQMITSNVLNNYSELMFLRSRIAQFVNSSTKEIHIIRLKDRTKGYNSLPNVYDNINSTTPDYEIPDLVRVALKDMGDPFELHCIVTYSNYGEAFNLLPNAVLIDMNDLVYISSPQLK